MDSLWRAKVSGARRGDILIVSAFGAIQPHNLRLRKNTVIKKYAKEASPAYRNPLAKMMVPTVITTARVLSEVASNIPASKNGGQIAIEATRACELRSSGW